MRTILPGGVQWLRALLMATLALVASAQVKQGLQGYITITISGQATWQEEGDTEPRSARVFRTARHEVRFDPMEASPGNEFGIAVHRGWETAFSARVDESESGGEPRQGAVSGKCPGGQDPVLLGAICAEGAVSMGVDPKARTYSFLFNTLSVELKNHTIPVSGLNVGPIPLPPPGQTRLTGSQTFDVHTYQSSQRRTPRSALKFMIPQQVPAKAVVTWDLDVPELLEVVVESSQYANWIPEGNFQNPAQPGNHITFTATVRDRTNPGKKSDKKARLTFRLEDTSMEKGVCLNEPKEGAKSDYDLQLRKAENPKLDIVGPDEARTTGEVSEAALTVASFDYGGWAQLRITAEAASGKIPVRFEGKENSAIPLPKNSTGQHTATAWLRRIGREGALDNADDERATGQTEIGDGLSIYERYRGVVVLEGGGPVFRRLEPEKKFHFVIDEKNGIDSEQWEKATGSVLVRVDKTLVRDRRLNFNSGYASAGNKYAVPLEVISGVVDPHTRGIAPEQLGYTAYGGRPSDAERCVVFPDRIRDKIGRILANIKKGLDDPQGEYGEMILQAGFSIEEARGLYAALTPARRGELAQRLTKMTALHELSHSANVPGHGPIPPFGQEWKEKEDLFDEGCMMQYFSPRSWRRFILAGELDGEGKLCPVCLRSFNVKD